MTERNATETVATTTDETPKTNATETTETPETTETVEPLAFIAGDGNGRKMIGLVGSITYVPATGEGDDVTPHALRFGGVIDAKGREQATIRTSWRAKRAASARLSGEDATAFLASIGAGDGSDAKALAVALDSFRAKVVAATLAHRFVRVAVPAPADAKASGVGRVRMVADDAILAGLDAATL